MAPTVLHNVKGNSKLADHAPATSATSGTRPNDRVMLTSADVMGLEHKYGAHK